LKKPLAHNHAVAREWIDKQKPKIQETRGDEPTVVCLPIRHACTITAYSFPTKSSHEQVKTTHQTITRFGRNSDTAARK
jgi:hypothetical protein